MTWPTDDLATEHFDSGTDNPSRARHVLKRAIDILKAILAARGANNGICDLDSERRVPDGRIGKGLANGVCELDANAKVPIGRYPGIGADHEWSGTSVRFRVPGGGWSSWYNLQGPQGDPGPRGPEGPDGPKGPVGDRGPAGADGADHIIDRGGDGGGGGP